MAPPIALIAGNGSLPVELARTLAERDGGVLVFALEGEADAALSPFAPVPTAFPRLGAMFARMKDAGCRQVIMAGGVVRRPELARLATADGTTFAALASVFRSFFAGDNALLTAVIDFMNQRGLTVVGIADVAPNLLAQEGSVAGPAPSRTVRAQMASGIEVATALGQFDVGQGCVVVGTRAVALEGAEGTDAMLERVEGLRTLGRLPRRRDGVLVKWPKPEQDLRVDLPAIGPGTVRNAHLAGLRAIGVAAGRTVVLDRPAVGEAADRLGISVVGLPVE